MDFDFHSIKTVQLRESKKEKTPRTNKKIIQYIALMRKFGKNSKEANDFVQNNKFDCVFVTKANTVFRLFKQKGKK